MQVNAKSHYDQFGGAILLRKDLQILNEGGFIGFEQIFKPYNDILLTKLCSAIS
jgi:hypothetical protein